MNVIGEPSITQIVKALEQAYEYGGGKWKVTGECRDDKGKEH